MSERARRMLLFCAIAALVFACDRWGKNIALNSDWQNAPLVVGEFLRFVHVRNTGIAFGLFAGGGAAGVWILTAIALLLSAGFAFYVWRAGSFASAAAAALMAGGALGNAHDRLRYGYVVDFVDAHWGDYHWPAFNAADAAISVGAFWLAFLLARGGK